MSTTLSIRLGEDLARWVEEQARATGRSQGSLVKEALEKVRQAEQAKPFMKLAGSLEGPEDLSRRKGFSRP
ncbi:ribbon-helix-helix protein, CopG family [Luteolibacter sp. SL250]|uniref:ribbon-helix-helix protein, CopG family n=1 Tax=Luteolibacter sp. SL250 TaxID=2995170 RepID=UPI00226F2B78|nr:ribbon-helix-helix protein, CopG family [Luteolibacter sp. SL250]WAC18005.1 ribbon-helix-helix protein, CopG family [Luteolibacter sp. SL250]